MIDGIAISNYRSIGDEQLIYPLGKINVFVGPNNSGKSNVLRFVNTNLALALQNLRTANKLNLKSDSHIDIGEQTTAKIGFSASTDDLSKILKTNNNYKQAIEALHNNLFSNHVYWIGDSWPQQDLINKAAKWMTSGEWNRVWRSATGSGSGDLYAHWIPGVLKAIRLLIPEPPSVYEIPISRQADSQNKPASDSKLLGGRGVILKLASMQNPAPTHFDRDRKYFEQIESFVRTVTDDETAQISVPHSQDQILVKLAGQKFLPLADLGSGIEQVVLHAIAATSAINSVVTFEEPELHLHPVLQKQLLTYLATKTTNQYFISTHSAHMIDTLHANVFHVQLIDNQTKIQYANTDAARHRVCEELGYRPSDIVQSNCVIWVEGPSDRIYLEYWIKSHDPRLQLDVHYSVMFYGGKLLSHLTAAETDDPDSNLENLIKLRMLNRHVAVIIDSDKNNANQEIRETKQRVVNEIEDSGGIAWVTEGREIENYIPIETLQNAVESVVPGRGDAVRTGKYLNPLPPRTHGGRTSINKIDVAKAVVSHTADLSRFDLQNHIENVCEFIRKANGIK